MRASTSIAFGALAALAAFVAGCSSSGPPPGTTSDASVVEIGSPPEGLDAGLVGSQINLPVGIVVEIEVQSAEGDAQAIAVTASDRTRVTVLPMVTPADFALVGVAPGLATLGVSIGGNPIPSFSVNGATITTLSVDVTGPPGG